jgi:hypothetical protein
VQIAKIFPCTAYQATPSEMPPPSEETSRVLEHCPKGYLKGAGLMHYFVAISGDRFIKAIPATKQGVEEAKLNQEIYYRFKTAKLEAYIPKLYSASYLKADRNPLIKHDVILLEFERILGKSLSQLKREGVYSHEEIKNILDTKIAPMLLKACQDTGYFPFDRNSGNFMESTNEKGEKVITMVDFTPCFVKDLSEMKLKQIFSKSVMGAKLLKGLSKEEKGLLEKNKSLAWKDLVQHDKEVISFEGLEQQTLKAWVDSKIDARIREHLAHEHRRNRYDWRAGLKNMSIKYGFNHPLVSLLHRFKK